MQKELAQSGKSREPETACDRFRKIVTACGETSVLHNIIDYLSRVTVDMERKKQDHQRVEITKKKSASSSRPPYSLSSSSSSSSSDGSRPAREPDSTGSIDKVDNVLFHKPGQASFGDPVPSKSKRASSIGSSRNSSSSPSRSHCSRPVSPSSTRDVRPKKDTSENKPEGPQELPPSPEPQQLPQWRPWRQPPAKQSPGETRTGDERQQPPCDRPVQQAWDKKPAPTSSGRIAAQPPSRTEWYGAEQRSPAPQRYNPTPAVLLPGPSKRATPTPSPSPTEGRKRPGTILLPGPSKRSLTPARANARPLPECTKGCTSLPKNCLLYTSPSPRD